jgi:hypothetical protein
VAELQQHDFIVESHIFDGFIGKGNIAKMSGV